MRTIGFELETNQDRYHRDIDPDRTVRGLIGSDWVEAGVRRVSLRYRLRTRIALWIWKPSSKRARDEIRSSLESGDAMRIMRKAA